MKEESSDNGIALAFVFSLFTLPSLGKKKKPGEASACFDVSLSCRGCERIVITDLTNEEGIREVKADHTTKRVFVVYRSDKTDPETIAGAIRKLGYSARILEDGDGGCLGG